MEPLSLSHSNKPYTNIARYYDLLMKDVKYDEWIEYILETINLFNIKTTPLLDVTCGTGNSTIPFLNRNLTPILGMDNSIEMLKVAKEKKPDLLLVQANALRIPFLNYFNLAISMFDSLNYLLELKKLIQAFYSIKEALKPEGHFIFDLNTPYGLRCASGREVREENQNFISIWRNSYDKDSKILTLHLTLFVKENGRWRRIDEIHKERGYEEEEVKYALKLSNFKVINTFKCFEHNKVDKFTRRILYVAKKNGAD
ncbi:MAG: class I SAM-dependent methyltransferase [candidate division WOR-3 bacterium]